MGAQQETGTRQPNIIWIMADDLSWGDIGCFGQKLIQTPNIDRLAKEGMRFTHCYSGSAVCAPSRSSLMQGLHQGHATVRANMIAGSYRHTLHPGEDTTVAEVLQDAGYATGIFGKWGLAVGDQPGIPNSMGFDEFYGYLNQRKAHNYYPEYLWHNRCKVEFPENRGHSTKDTPNTYDENGRIRVSGVPDPHAATYSFDLYSEKSLEFVRRAADRPFFLYLPYTPPHGALEVPELGEYTDCDWPTFPHKIWAAMVTRMDREIGRLLDLLTELGIADDTLIFFTSDNGYSAGGYVSETGIKLNDVFQHRGPWRGAKGRKSGGLYEGALRVPTIARWPGRIQAGTVSDLVWTFYDFLPTAAEAAGIHAPHGIDGVSILPTLLGRDREQQQPEYRYWEFLDSQAVRLGNWGFQRSHPDQPVEVYDLDADPGQERDLSADRPDLVKRAVEIFEDAHVQSPVFPSPGESETAWRERMRGSGITLPENVDMW